MAHSREVLDIAPLGIRVQILRTAEETGGEVLEVEVSGNPRGFLAQRHVHPTQAERLEMVQGTMKVVLAGQTHLVREGESIEIPAGEPHTQTPVGSGAGCVRIQTRPAGRTQAFLERLAELSSSGKIGRAGFPKPLAAAELILDYGDTGHAATPPVAVQRAFARAVRALGNPFAPYLFIDEWEVAAAPDAVFHGIADARTYPEWWRPVYIEVEADGPPSLGGASRQHFKGRLPYHLRTRSIITALDPPRSVTAEVDGDLRGRGVWTLTPSERGTHVRFDWQVYADRRLLRTLTPVLRPLFRWNHNWAIARAMEGLEPWARAAARREEAAGEFSAVSGTAAAD
jgi:quercetin dioxygenase-like cupin family protein/uncharacterized protein YndB with AHSA1/START domain